jgi:hypothetical protein
MPDRYRRRGCERGEHRAGGLSGGDHVDSIGAPNRVDDLAARERAAHERAGIDGVDG